jgi:hypothetical protein
MSVHNPANPESPQKAAQPKGRAGELKKSQDFLSLTAEKQGHKSNIEESTYRTQEN